MEHVTLVRNASRLLRALAHYMSIADNFGEGIIMVPKDNPTLVEIALLYNPSNPVDSNDWKCLYAKLDEIKGFGFPFLLEQEDSLRGFEIWRLRLPESRINEFADLLLDHPGPLGWGSMREQLEQHGYWEGKS